MNARDDLRAKLHAALDALLDVIDRPGDELVPIARDALRALGLEEMAVRRLAETGTLRAVTIGRRRYTKRSWLLALADTLPPLASLPAEDEVVVAVRRRAQRKRMR